MQGNTAVVAHRCRFSSLLGTRNGAGLVAWWLVERAAVEKAKRARHGVSKYKNVDFIRLA